MRLTFFRIFCSPIHAKLVNREKVVSFYVSDFLKYFFKEDTLSAVVGASFFLSSNNTFFLVPKTKEGAPRAGECRVHVSETKSFG